MLPLPTDLPEPELSRNTAVVLQKRYQRKNPDGSLEETPRDLFWRVAAAIAAQEAAYQSPYSPEALAREFYELMTSWKFLPNSPTLMNAGTDLGQLSACFVLPVGDSIEEIFDAVKYAAMIHKSGGGTGFSFSRLRPRDSRVGSTGFLFAHLQHGHRANQAGRHPARGQYGHSARGPSGHPPVHPRQGKGRGVQ